MILHRVAFKLKLLGKLRGMLTQFAAKSIYKSMILSLFDIGDVFYDSTTNKYLQKLQVLQNRAVRVIYKLRARSNVDFFHDKMSLMTLENRRKLHIMQLASWLSQQTSYVDNRKLPTRANNIQRRNLKVEKINKATYHKSFLYKASNYWNALPTETHCISDRDKLKTELRKALTR